MTDKEMIVEIAGWLILALSVVVLCTMAVVDFILWQPITPESYRAYAVFSALAAVGYWLVRDAS